MHLLFHPNMPHPVKKLLASGSAVFEKTVQRPPAPLAW
jgi:hypothetical protein